MTWSSLSRGDRGDDVISLQRLLNKRGALLEPDGAFGGGTERAVHDAQNAAGLEASGVADTALKSWLEALPDPSPELSIDAVSFIVRVEVGSRDYYERHVAMPHYPGAESGVTIGVGYDLRFQSEAEFETDWGDKLTQAEIDRLKPWIGVKGNASAVANLADIRVPFSDSFSVFTDRTLPKYIAQTRDAFGSAIDGLPPACKGALVSLVYNRGARMTGDGRREMREIRAHIENGTIEEVPAAFRAMKRLWQSNQGLKNRREAEAKLWEDGLADRAAA